MNIEPIVFFDLVIATVVLSVVLGMIVRSYVKTIEKTKILQKKESDIEEEAHKKAANILQETRSKAIKIIEDANFSQDLLKKTFEDQLKTASLEQAKKLEAISEEFLLVFQETLIELKNNNIKTVSNISKDIETSTKMELEDFKEILKKETFGSQKIVEEKIEQDYKAEEKELEIYKADKIKKIEGEIYNIIQIVSKEVIGKTLSLKEHEQLVIDALEKAKELKIVDGK